MKKLLQHPFLWIVLVVLGILVFSLIYFQNDKDKLGGPVEAKVKENHTQPRIRLAMTAAFVSESGVEVYEDIAKYLEQQTGQPFEFVTGLSYATVNGMLDAGTVDLGFVCGLPYVLKRDQASPPIRLLVAPVMKAKHYNNQPKYFSYVIVHKDSELMSFEDLEGCTYVYNDVISNSGYNMPRARLIELGKTEGFFAKLLCSGSHEESIRMVALGEADASSVDSLVFDFDLVKNFRYTKQIKIIEKLGPAGIPPLVVSIKMDDEQVKMIQKALVEMKDNAQGRAILDKALVDRFEIVEDSNYDDIRQMKKSAENAEFMEIK